MEGRCPKLDKSIINPVMIQMGVDPASTVTRRSDIFAIVPLAVTRDEKIYVLPYFRGRVESFDGAQKIIEYYTQYRHRIVCASRTRVVDDIHFSQPYCLI